MNYKNFVSINKKVEKLLSLPNEKHINPTGFIGLFTIQGTINPKPKSRVPKIRGITKTLLWI
ncbi:hypothetical protein GCM10011516_18140 [Sphingobacterium cellulitidis]|uniref:Uncharacterized protein n=1 Tax=Sphingobacterium cellulitidis TaxID=1768011 RepID=A0A8H9G1K5_9SPHI|nr:hypothetical protein GCM10011516_18140 [Sphingobacterium soli]